MATFLQGKCLETIAHHLEGSSQKTNHSLCFVGFRNAYYLIIQSYFQRKGGESQVHPRKGHKSLEMWHICNSNLSFISALGGVGGKHHPPAALHPGKTRYPLCRRLGGPQGWPGRMRNISPPPGFDPRTIQPVASRYTD